MFLNFVLITTLPFTGSEYSDQLEKLFKLSIYDRSAAHILLYEKEILPRLKVKPCTKMDKKELQSVKELLGTLVFYSYDKDLTMMHLFCFNQLNKIEKQSKKEISRVYHFLYRMRLFDDAREFYGKHSELGIDMLPQVSTSKKATKFSIFSIDKNRKNSFTRNSFDYRDYDGVIINATPLCGFCRYFISAVSKDKGLSLFMLNNSTWLSTPGKAKYFQAMLDWNQKYPYAELSIIENILDYKKLDLDGTPTLFFLKDGVIKDTIVGWPKEGRMKQLKQLIKKHYSIDLE